MTKKDTNAAQLAEPAPTPVKLSELNTLLNPELYEWATKDERGEDVDAPERPNVEVCATLSHETEDYVRIIKTLAEMLPVYHCALKGTYYGAEISRERYVKVLHLIQQLRDEIAHDMGVCIAERLSEWKDSYM